jgi:hypothetical protein
MQSALMLILRVLNQVRVMKVLPKLRPGGGHFGHSARVIGTLILILGFAQTKA